MLPPYFSAVSPHFHHLYDMVKMEISEGRMDEGREGEGGREGLWEEVGREVNSM